MTVRDTGMSDGYDLFWGDFHKHMTGPRRGNLRTDLGDADEIVGFAKQHLDVYAVLCYPFEMYRRGRVEGLTEESVRNRPRFLSWWDDIQDVSRRHHEPGSFVTFPAYEWHGNRRRWGDHNVIYFEEGYPLDDAWDLSDLYGNLADRRAFAVPHHTAYHPENRAKDWDVFDADLSPVMEIYSGQGSSEGVDTPVAMDTNPIMGPRTSGTTFLDGLDRGHRVGVIASNDWMGLPGTWNSGIAGIWARELTREAVWDALQNRRTYGVTGDRMALWFAVDGRPMGSVVDGAADAARVNIDCPQPLDRVELVRNGRVHDVYCHQPRWREWADSSGRYRILVEFGWGPSPDLADFDSIECRWRGALTLERGTIEDVVPRFSGFGQTYDAGDDECRFALRTARAPTSNLPPSRADVKHYKQGLILDVDAPDDAVLAIRLDDGTERRRSLRDARTGARVFPLMEESIDRIEDEFDLTPDDLDNHGTYYSNARKIKVHPAYPVGACAADVAFENLPAPSGNADHYYVRASQVDGQYAWSSPIWVEP